MDISKFDNVEEARQAMIFRARMWRALNEWSDLTEKWQTSPFDQIEVSEISAKADQFTKNVIQCERNLP